MRVRRSDCGNMLLLALFFLALIIVMLILGTMMFGVFLSQQHAQHTIDEWTTQAAIGLNDSDKAGRMNQLVNWSRQLVASSHDTYDEVFESKHYNLEPLAYYLLDQSRNGAELVDNARGLCIADTLNTLSTKATNRFANNSGNIISLPWIEAHGPRLLSLSVGRVKDTDSSIYISDQLPHVVQSDLSKKLVNPRSTLYRGDVDARLDDEDAYIPFRLSSLPAAVRGMVSQSRLVDSESFVSTADLVSEGKRVNAACKYMPSAVYVRSEYTIINKLGVEEKHKLIVSSTAVTSGACP